MTHGFSANWNSAKWDSVKWGITISPSQTDAHILWYS